MPDAGRTRSQRETLDIPEDVRHAVDDRDQGHCRVCGKYLGPARALHHVKFGGDHVGIGGRRRHDALEIVTVCWMWAGNCHDRVHAHKSMYQEILLEIAGGQQGGQTALQLLRQRARSSGGHAFSLDEVKARFVFQLRATPSGCLEWTGPRTDRGYGVCNYQALLGRPVGAHRVAWFLKYGQWPAQDLLHSCDNPPCCNLDHLREGTQTENMADRRLRSPRYGAANPHARHADLVEPIRQRAAAGESQASIARSLGLNSGVVSRIVRGVNYPFHLQDSRSTSP